MTLKLYKFQKKGVRLMRKFGRPLLADLTFTD